MENESQQVESCLGRDGGPIGDMRLQGLFCPRQELLEQNDRPVAEQSRAKTDVAD